VERSRGFAQTRSTCSTTRPGRRPPGEREQFSSGLLFLNGTAKVDYAAFRLPLYLPITATKPGRSLEVWGEVRPAAFAKHDTGLRSRSRSSSSPPPAARGRR
jgi:hypothetical protein